LPPLFSNRQAFIEDPIFSSKALHNF